MSHTIEYHDPSGQTLTLTAGEAFELARKSLPQREEARHLLERVIHLDPAHRDALNLLGLISVEARQPLQAISYFERAIALGELSPEVAARLGWRMAEEGKREQAVAYLRHVLKSPQSAETATAIHAFIARTLNGLECFDAAIEHFRQALAFPLPPKIRASAANGLGHALVQLGRFAEAAPCFAEALEVPDDPALAAERHTNLGMVLGELGQFAEEFECYDRALALADSPRAHVNRSLAALRLGDFALGWREYEYRWGKGAPQNDVQRSFTEPLWDGGDIAGRRILLHAEQGLGDTIQFVRYVPLVAARGAVVILEVQPALKPLLTGLPGTTAVIARGEPIPEFDVQCPLLSLPLAFGTTVETIPHQVPYLTAAKEALHTWESRLAAENRLKVGIVWAGSQSHKKDRIRSASFECLAPLLDLHCVRFYSFQVGPRSVDAHRLGPFVELTDLAPLLADFNQTAAALLQMDLLISVDTSVAHLGGAVGVETWVLLPAVADWRWMVGRSDNPWYPGMRLFRQTVGGDWQPVVEEVRRELARKCGSLLG